MMTPAALALVAIAALSALIFLMLLRRRQRRMDAARNRSAAPAAAGDYLHRINAYIQPGDPGFEHQSRDLREHMRAAHAAQQAPPLPDPDAIGDVPPDVLADLWQMMSYVGSNWQIGASSGLTGDTFTAMVALKTTQTPSYLTVYQMASALFRQLASQLGSADAALAYLYSPAPGDPPPGWDVVNAWVMQEFTTLYVSQGAFRAYGWWLYPGFEGGPFSDPAALPYRTLVSAD